MIKFLQKFENCGIKIAGVNSIITKSINLQLFYINFVWSRGLLWLKAIFHAQSIYREAYAPANEVYDICGRTVCLQSIATRAVAQ